MMNDDSHLIFEAYTKKLTEGFEYFGQKAEKSSSEDEESKECGKGCTCGKCEKCTPEYIKEHGLGEDAEKEEKHNIHHYHGAAKAVHHALKNKVEDEESLAAKMEHHMRKIYGDKFNEKKAHKAIEHTLHQKVEHEKGEDCEGPQWDRMGKSGVIQAEKPGREEDAEKKHVFTKTFKAAERGGYSKKAAEKIAGAVKANYEK
jgi:hypothetical protein